MQWNENWYNVEINSNGWVGNTELEKKRICRKHDWNIPNVKRVKCKYIIQINEIYVMFIYLHSNWARVKC